MVILKVLALVLAFTSTGIAGREGITEDCRLKLEYAEALYGSPIFITSGYRNKEHNKEVGGVPNSYHLLGEAVDIRLPSTQQKAQKLIKALQDAGFGGIGVYSAHIHADTRKESVFWRGK